MMTIEELSDNDVVVDCSDCGTLLVVSSKKMTVEKLACRVAGRILGRPYCSTCLCTKSPVIYHGYDTQASDNYQNARENGVRALEDCGC